MTTMEDNRTKIGVVDINKLERDMARDVADQPARFDAKSGTLTQGPEAFAQPKVRAAAAIPSMMGKRPLDQIADAIKRLVWDDNEKLGQMIAEHYGDAGKASMSAAVQRAADDLLKEQ